MNLYDASLINCILYPKKEYIGLTLGIFFVPLKYLFLLQLIKIIALNDAYVERLFF